MIDYIPDYAKFKITNISESMIKIAEKHTYDVCAFATTANVTFNKEKINIRTLITMLICLSVIKTSLKFMKR